jgi:hypothetical protein
MEIIAQEQVEKPSVATSELFVGRVKSLDITLVYLSCGPSLNVIELLSKNALAH